MLAHSAYKCGQGVKRHHKKGLIESVTGNSGESYLKLLKNYHSTMEKGEDRVVTVDTLQYEKNHDDIPGHYIFSALQTAEYNVDESVMDKQRFREWMSNPEHPTVNNYSLSEISYYTGTNAPANHEAEQLQELEDELANYTPNFILNKAGEKNSFPNTRRR